MNNVSMLFLTPWVPSAVPTLNIEILRFLMKREQYLIVHTLISFFFTTG